MREIKAFIRTEMVDRVVHALRDAGITHMTLSHVRSLGSGVDPTDAKISTESGSWFTESVKLEAHCPAPDVERIVRVLNESARTGHPGDGLILVSPVERAVEIGSDERTDPVA